MNRYPHNHTRPRGKRSFFVLTKPTRPKAQDLSSKKKKVGDNLERLLPPFFLKESMDQAKQRPCIHKSDTDTRNSF